MLESDVLNESKLRLQCNTAANLLSERNGYLTKLKEVHIAGSKIEDTGESANAIKCQCNAYKSLIDGMIIANEYDRYDHLLLESLLGSDNIVGTIVFAGLKYESSEEAKCRSNASTCRSNGDAAEDSLLAHKWYEAAANWDRQGDNHYSAWCVWNNKRNHFDYIVTHSSSLFQNSKQYREYIRQGLSDIAFSFAKGTYNVSGWATWKKGIDKLNMQFQQEQKDILDSLFDDKDRIDQEKVNELLNKRLSELTPAEYALIIEIANLDAKQMAQKIADITGRKVNEEDVDVIDGILSTVSELTPIGRIIHSGYSVGEAAAEGDSSKMGEALFTLGGDFTSLVSDLAGKAGEGAEALKVGCKWGAHIFDFGVNAIENIEEQKLDKDMTDGRVVAETISETIVDIGVVEGGTALAGLAMVALGVSAPAVLVGAGVVALWWGANALTEHFTGKDATEHISDWVLDLF